MTKLIPLDDAIAAVNLAIWKSPIKAQISTIDASNDTAEALRAIPAIDPAAIREAALREALQRIGNWLTPTSIERMNGHEDAYRAVEALIGEKK